MGKKPYDIRKRTYLFTRESIVFGRQAVTLRDFVLNRLVYQLVDAAGSVGANLEEAGDADILKGFATSAQKMKITWWARAGAAEIAGYPVLVSEPNLSQERALRVCRAIQLAAGGCPVSFNRCPQRGRLRIAIWFTALPSEEVRLAEVAQGCGGVLAIG